MVELKKRDVRMLIRLVTDEIDRMAKVKEKYSFYDEGYFNHLVDIRNKLVAMPLDEELPSGISGKEWQKLLRG